MNMTHEHSCLFVGTLRSLRIFQRSSDRWWDKTGKSFFMCLHLFSALSACVCMTYPREVFSQGKYRAAGVSLFMCVRVWSPLNDYYGLTPISRAESLHPRLFHSPGNGKENVFPSVAYYRDLVLYSRTPRHQNHTEPPTHALVHTGNMWQANIWVCVVLHMAKDCGVRILQAHESN